MRAFSSLLILLISILSYSNSNYPENHTPIGGHPSITKKYKNPIIGTSLPDPTVMKAPDGYFYLYATEDIRNVPIYRSKDLVNWKFVATAFTDVSRPSFVRKGCIWAPDIHYINGKYVLYYAMSRWGEEWDCGVGVATADKPGGPFTDKGKLFIGKEVHIQNCIDPFYIEDGGKKFLFWGSFRGIYGTQLNKDGLSLKADSPIIQIAGTAMEATYIFKRGKYYYLFGSNGTCCEGLKSTYRIIYARSTSLFGPYLSKDGGKILENNYEVLIHKSDKFVGTGHNAEFITDDKGNDWIIYHAYQANDPDAGRVVMMDHIQWINDWPSASNTVPSNESNVPYFK